MNSHTDFIFAVAAEEYGLIACLILLCCCSRFHRAPRPVQGIAGAGRIIRYATAGLIMLFGIQTLINMAVNVGLLPAKGMTLPFISYGGSSLLAMALTARLCPPVSRGNGRWPVACRRSRAKRKVPPVCAYRQGCFEQVA